MNQSNAALAAPEANATLAVGTMLCEGQFTLTHPIGAGGFGLTYKAEDNILGRTVVIKECFPEDFCMRQGADVVPRNQQHATQFQSIVTMFMREARSLAKLRHPNIVGVHRAFEENNTAYMVLDLIEGEDLLNIVHRSPEALTPDAITELLFKLLDAVEKVHEMDLLHRDIAPDNIMIDKEGTPVLIDFGAARGDASRKTRMISSLLVVKDGYSPQEFYVAGSSQTPSSDLFALGATFYHLLTGKAPMSSQARMVEIAGKKDDPVPPLKGRIKGYPKAFLDAIDRAMKIMPADRLQSAGEWRDLISGTASAKSAPKSATKSSTQPTRVLTPDLEKSLTKLIEETNVVVSEDDVVDKKPKVEAPPAPVAQKPDWLEEFNQETTGEVTHPSEEDAPARRPSNRPPARSAARKTRIVLPAGAEEARPSGWALDKIQKKHSRPLSEPAEAPEPVTYSRREIAPEIAGEVQASMGKQLVRMGLLGTFFGIIVYVGTNVVLYGGA